MSSAFYILLQLHAFSTVTFMPPVTPENNSKLVAFEGNMPNL